MGSFSQMAFVPTVEPYVTESTFIAEDAITASRKAWTNGLDILIGGTSYEGLFYMSILTEMPMIMKSFGKMLAFLPGFADDMERNESLAMKIKRLYYDRSSTAVNAEGFCRVIFHQIYCN